MLSGSVTKAFGPDLAEGEPWVLSLESRVVAGRSQSELQTLLTTWWGAGAHLHHGLHCCLFMHVYSALWKVNPSHQGKADETVLDNVTKQTGELLSLLLVFLKGVPSCMAPVTVSWFF